MAGGILPVARYRGQLFFLFGREVQDGMWSDFGGSREGNETTWQTAMREGSEELNGFFGSAGDLSKLATKHCVLEINNGGYTTYIFEIDFDKKLPLYFNNNYRFSRKYLSREISKKNGLFEKSSISWYTLSEIKRSRKFFRPFYRSILDILINNIDEIEKNLKSRE